MGLFSRGPRINDLEAVALAQDEARRRSWAWESPEALEDKKGWHVRLRPDAMESPFVLLSFQGKVLKVGFEDRYLSDEGDWDQD